MSDQVPRSRRRRIAGETAPAETPAPPAKKSPAKKSAATSSTPAKKTPTKKTTASTTSTQQSAPAAKKAPAKKAPAKKAPAKAAAGATAVPEKTSTSASTTTRSTTAGGSSQVAAARQQRAAKATTTAPAARTTSATSQARTIVATAVAAVVLAAGVTVAVLGVNHWRGTGADGAREDAVSAATKAAEEIFSFQYDELEEHQSEVKQLMTPTFAKEYDTIAPALSDLAPQRKVSVEAVSRNAAVLPCGDECSLTKASVLVFLDQDRRIEDEGTSTVFGNRIVVSVVERDGDWKVDDIRAL